MTNRLSSIVALLVALILTGCASTARVDVSIYRLGDSLCVRAGVVDSALGYSIAPREKCWPVFRIDAADTTVIDTIQIVTGQ